MLFPVRLDEAIMTKDEAWAVKLRARLIGDFRLWKDHGSYKQGFEQAMHDLAIPPKVP